MKEWLVTQLTKAIAVTWLLFPSTTQKVLDKYDVIRRRFSR